VASKQVFHNKGRILDICFVSELRISSRYVHIDRRIY